MSDVSTTNKSLDHATEKAQLDYVNAAAREDELRAQYEEAKRITNACESIFLGYKKAKLIIDGRRTTSQEIAA